MSNPFTQSSTTPASPIRPEQSVYRMSTSNHTTRSLPIDTNPPQTPTTPAFLPSTPVSPPGAWSPRTPTSPATQAVAKRKSSASIRRKPVPLEMDDMALPTFQLGTPRTNTSSAPGTPSTPSSVLRTPGAPPTYVLPVNPPSYPAGSSTSPYVPRHDAQALGIDTGLGQSRATLEDLPRYTEDMETEPQTLARSLWKWGWLCPLLWAVGMCIVWIPLRPIEEEPDAHKAQKLEEMIVILRETELKYAKRCLWGFVGFALLVISAVILGVVLSRVL